MCIRDRVLRGRTGEGVDRLGRVADDTYLVAPAKPQIQQSLLQGVDVLVFVDDEVPVLLSDLPGHIGAVGEDPAHDEQDVLCLLYTSRCV